MPLSALINEHYEKLNQGDLHILKYVQAHLSACSDISILSLAKLCSVSSTSILRTTQKLGFSGFSEFKYFLKRDNASVKRTLLRYSLESLHADIQQTIKMFEQNAARNSLFQTMENADHLYGYGTGHGQRLMMSELARCLLNVKKNLILLPELTELKIASQNFAASDLLFIVSLSGNVPSLNKTLQQLDILQIPIVSITNLQNNELASVTKYNFYFQASNIEETSKLNQSSFLTLHLLLHLIYEGYVGYLLKRNKAFNPAD